MTTAPMTTAPMTQDRWTDRYLGIPFEDHGRSREGCDCWGLACVIYQEELGITLSEYLGDYVSAAEHREISALISKGKTAPLWMPVEGPAIALDIALFRRGRWSSHIGIVVKHGLMIHISGESHARIETYARGPWAHRLEGVYRHVKRAAEYPVQIVSEAAR